MPVATVACLLANRLMEIFYYCLIEFKSRLQVIIFKSKQKRYEKSQIKQALSKTLAKIRC
jgi:hypothetical protein